MARLLVERETIFTEEVDMLMEGKSVEEIMEFMDENERNLQENPFARKSRHNPVIIPETEKEKADKQEDEPVQQQDEKEDKDE